MNLRFTISGRIARPLDDMYESVLFPMQTGPTEKNRRIALRWGAAPGTADADESGEPCTAVTMDFQALPDGRTLVSITEEGWAQRPEGLAASYNNCEGWTGMLCAMKAWLEHGLQLRQGFYK